MSWQLDDVANKVCSNLPEGWHLSLEMEQGAAWVALHNPQGDRVLLPDEVDHEDLLEQINASVSMAIDEEDA